MFQNITSAIIRPFLQNGEKMQKETRQIASGALLVAGTAVGAGMLGLPVSTAMGGFWPSMLLYLACYLFMTITGLLLLEACLWMPKDANIVSLSSHLLGRRGKFASWFLYLFLFYCLTVAYITGGGALVQAAFPLPISQISGILFFVVCFTPIVAKGAKAVDRVNFIFMLGLIFTYFFFVFSGLDHVQPKLLQRHNLTEAFHALPIVFTSFSFQGLIPTLTGYMDRKPKLIRRSIWWGTSLAFVIYIIWQYLILGIVPLEGENGLLQAKELGQSAIIPLKYFVKSSLVYTVGQLFSFFALTTSFLGVSLGLLDFLADGLKLHKTGFDRAKLFCLVFIPPLIIALVKPDLFLIALTFAGGIGCALLLGLIPILMVIRGRYYKGLGLQYQQVRGGKILFTLLILFVLFELLIEIKQEIIPVFF